LQQIFSYIDRIFIAEPDKLDLLILVPALIFLAVILWSFKFFNRPKRTYGSQYPVLGTFKFWLSVNIVLSLSVFALARPFIPTGNLVLRRGNVEVIFLIDYSSSMFLKDTGWARIDIATREISNLFTSEAVVEGDRLALFVFGSGASRRMPMNRDFNLAANEIQMIGRPNTLIGDNTYWASDVPIALQMICSMMDRQDMLMEFGREIPNWKPVPKQNRLIFIFSDGGNLLQPNPDKEIEAKDRLALNTAIKELNRRNLKIYPVGIGTRGGAPVIDILKDYKEGDQYDPRLKEDLKGQISRLNSAGLEYLSRTTGSGGIFIVENDKTSASNFMRSSLNRHRSTIIEPSVSKEREELWRDILIVSLAIFILGLWVTKF
jgi:hypothetical protein